MSGLTDIATRYSQVWKAGETGGAATTLTIWTPASSMRVVVTGFDLANSSGVSGTISIYFINSPTSVGKRIASYNLESSTSIAPRFAGLEGPSDVDVRAVTKNSGPWSITVYGFEMS